MTNNAENVSISQHRLSSFFMQVVAATVASYYGKFAKKWDVEIVKDIEVG